jgi:lysophospholipase L1-like esterase
MLKKALLGVAVSVFILLALEGASRIFYTIRDDMRSHETAWYVLSPDLGWTRRPSYRGEVGGYPREFDQEGYFAVDSPQVTGNPNPKRVMFLGDSNTFGFGAATRDSFPEVLETLVPEVATINLGVVGATSYQGRVALSKYLPILKPSVVVASFNFNDRRYVHKRDEIDGPEYFKRQWAQSVGIPRAISTLLSYSYNSKLIRSGLQRSGIVPKPSDMIDVSKVFPRVDEESYRHNLEEIAKETARNHVPLIFILLKDNPLEADFLNGGIERFTNGDLPGAAVLLEKAVTRENTFSDLARLYLSKVLQAMGKEGEAETVLFSRDQWSLTGGRPVKLDRDYNRIMQEVAAQYGVRVVDARKVLDEEPGDYVDFCHFNAAGHRKVGQLLAEAISELTTR